MVQQKGFQIIPIAQEIATFHSEDFFGLDNSACHAAPVHVPEWLWELPEMSFALAYGYFVKLHGSHPHKEWSCDFAKGCQKS